MKHRRFSSVPSPSPFVSQADYLDAEFSWLSLYVQLCMGQQHVLHSVQPQPVSPRILGRVETISDKEHQRWLASLRDEVDAMRHVLDIRLAVHRREGKFPLGLDEVCSSAGLNADERFLLIVLTLPAISQPWADTIMGGWISFGGAINIGDLLRLLQPQGVAAWLAAQRLFTISSPLLRYSLIALDFPSRIHHVGDLFNATACLSVQALTRIVGVAEWLHDTVQPHDDSPTE